MAMAGAVITAGRRVNSAPNAIRAIANKRILRLLQCSQVKARQAGVAMVARKKVGTTLEMDDETIIVRVYIMEGVDIEEGDDDGDQGR
jgi:hypothetical protein